MNLFETYKESGMFCPGWFYQKTSQKEKGFAQECSVQGGRKEIGYIVRVAEKAWNVLSGWQKRHRMYCPGGINSIGCIVRVAETAGDVLCVLANLCGMFCSGWQIMA